MNPCRRLTQWAADRQATAIKEVGVDHGRFHVLVTEGLVLSGGRYLFVYGQVGKKGFHFSDAHFLRVPFVVEQDVALDPGDVGLFCAQRVVLAPDGIADLI